MTSVSTALSRSSNSPRYFAPATSAPMSSAKTVLSRSPSGTSPVGDALGEALDDRGLADAGVADEHRVVLGLAGQDLHDAADLGVAADHRVEPSGAGVGDEVAAVFLQRLVGDLGHGGGDPLVAADRGQRLQERVAGDARRRAGAGAQVPSRALVDQRDQQVLDRDVLVLEPGRFARAASSRRPSRWVTRISPGAAPGPLTRGLRSSSASSSVRSCRGRRPPDAAAAARARRAGRAARAAGARRRPRCARTAGPWSARRAALPATSGSAC